MLRFFLKTRGIKEYAVTHKLKKLVDSKEIKGVSVRPYKLSTSGWNPKEVISIERLKLSLNPKKLNQFNMNQNTYVLSFLH